MVFNKFQFHEICNCLKTHYHFIIPLVRVSVPNLALNQIGAKIHAPYQLIQQVVSEILSQAIAERIARELLTIADLHSPKMQDITNTILRKWIYRISFELLEAIILSESIAVAFNFNCGEMRRPIFHTLQRA